MTAKEQRSRMAKVFIFQLSFFTRSSSKSSLETSRALSLFSLSLSFPFTYIHRCTLGLFFRCGPHCDEDTWLVRESCITHPHRHWNAHLHKSVHKNTFYPHIYFYVCTHTSKCTEDECGASASKRCQQEVSSTKLKIRWFFLWSCCWEIRLSLWISVCICISVSCICSLKQEAFL